MPLSTRTWAVSRLRPPLPSPASCTSLFPFPSLSPWLGGWPFPTPGCLIWPLSCQPFHSPAQNLPAVCQFAGLPSGRVSWTNSSTASYDSLLLLPLPIPGHSLSKPDPSLGATQASGLSAAPHLCPAGLRLSLDVPVPSLPSLAPELWCCVAWKSDAHRAPGNCPVSTPHRMP